MERVKVTDEWLYRYMPIVDAVIIQELEKQVDANYEFSHKFERRMKRLVRQEARPWLRVIHNIVKRVAIFFVGIIGATLIFTMSVEAYRTKFFDTIRTFLEDFVLYSYYTDEEAGMLQNSEPNFMPEGYKEVERIENSISLIIIYENEIGEQIIWEQKLIIDGGNLLLDSEYDTQEIQEIDGGIATVFLYSDGYAMAYYEREESAYLITADRLDSEDLFRIIDSIDE